MNNKIYLCSFASNDLENSVKRFLYQAEKMGIYENIKIFRPSDLGKDITYKVKDLYYMNVGYKSFLKKAVFMKYIYTPIIT